MMHGKIIIRGLGIEGFSIVVSSFFSIATSLLLILSRQTDYSNPMIENSIVCIMKWHLALESLLHLSHMFLNCRSPFIWNVFYGHST
mmetsp:Transcript_12093/g.22632  ORF Transcript_12093/g.22632 Transcript_12093/m.22632 type:complete len:87 (+) Transcript_12093:1706-1966(+)